MKGKQLRKYAALFIALFMVFALFAPVNVSANTDQQLKRLNLDESQLLVKAAVAEQLNVHAGPALLHKDLQGLSGDEEIGVIIHLSEKPVALEKGVTELQGRSFTANQANNARKKVNAQQGEVMKAMRGKRVNFSQGYTFDTVLNGFAAKVKADDLDKLLDIEGITLVEPDTIVYASEESPYLTSTHEASQVSPMMNTSNSFLGIEKLWEQGLEGQGIKVAVLDTGIDADHPEFAGIYKGGKNFVLHTGNDYTRPRADDDASETSPLERPAHRPEVNANGSTFHTTHGTHVAGTIAAIGANDYGIKGIAPKVDLYMYRVLGAYGSGATSGIIKGIETAVLEDMDIINLSLGGGANSEAEGSAFAVNNAMIAGVITVSATGNSGPNRGTIGTPATSRLGIAVGNTTNPETMHYGQVNITVGDFQLSKQVNLMATTFNQQLESQLSGEYELVAVPNVGAATDYEGIDVRGKIALIARGSIAFVDKIEQAKNNGAIGAIIHNFAGGTNAPDASGVFLGDSFEYIPTFDLSQTDGEAIRAALEQGSATVTFNQFGSETTLGDEVNSSSSRGPTTPNFDIKPDVSAPGTNIMSAMPMYKADFPDADYTEAYARKTGTSMAAPHIAGIAALIKQANPSWNAFDVKVALSNTAKILNTAQYDVFTQGAGRVDAYAAAFPSALAYAIDEAVLDSSGAIVENLKGTVTFGPQTLKDGAISVSKEIVVKDIKGIGGKYNVSVAVTKPFADAVVTVDKPSFTLNGEERLTVTLTASQNTATKLGDELLGYIHITPEQTVQTKTTLTVDPAQLTMKKGDKQQLTVSETTTAIPTAYTKIALPFAADFGGVAPTEIRNMAITKTDLSFNGDGFNDSATLSFTLTGNVGTNFIEIWDMLNPDGGAYGDGYIGYLHASSSLAAGSYSLDVRGLYQPWSGGNPTVIPDGLYTIDFNATSTTGPVADYVGPVIVKTTAPEIEGKLEAGVVTGQIVDRYIDYNDTLAGYGLHYNVNEKLKASYVVTENGVTHNAVAFDLNQDGTFSFDLSELNEQAVQSIKVIVTDAAGNVGEQLIYEQINEVSNEVNLQETVLQDSKDHLIGGDNEVTSLSSSIEAQAEQLPNLKGIQTKPFNHQSSEQGTQLDGPTRYTVSESGTSVDVTAKATYSVANKNIASVSNKGIVTAKNEGTTTIIVRYGGKEVHVPVVVTKEVKPEKPGKPDKPDKPEKPEKPEKPGNPGKG